MADAMPWTIERDLIDVVGQAQDLWADLEGARILLTGGTGFIGSWLLEVLRFADTKLNLRLKVEVLTRNPSAYARKVPHLAGYRAFELLEGDVRSLAPAAEQYRYIIHAATDADADMNQRDPRLMFDTIVDGTRRVLDIAVEKRAQRSLFLSSGAVYGKQPWEVAGLGESWRGAPDQTNALNAYGEGKRAAEMLCAIYGKQFGLSFSTARIFALLGPYLPLGSHFAAGNFIRDAMAGNPLVIKGDGKPVRSYLYASDCIVWLLKILVRGDRNVAYNVGSEEGVSIRQLADTVSGTLGGGPVQVLGASDAGWNPGRYVPDTSLAARTLGLYKSVSLPEAIRRTALWNGWKGDGHETV